MLYVETWKLVAVGVLPAVLCVVAIGNRAWFYGALAALVALAPWVHGGAWEPFAFTLVGLGAYGAGRWRSIKLLDAAPLLAVVASAAFVQKGRYDVHACQAVTVQPASGTPSDPSALAGLARAPASVDLVGLDRTVSGEPAALSTAPVLDLDADALGAWNRRAAKGKVHQESGLMDPLEGPVARAIVTLVPGGAREASLYFGIEGGWHESAKWHAHEILVPSDHPADAPLTIAIDMAAEWATYWTLKNTHAVQRAGIAFEGGTDASQLVGLKLLGPNWAFETEPVKVGAHEADRVHRRSVAAVAGMAVDIPVAIPEGATAFTWFDSGDAGAKRVVQFLEGDTVVRTSFSEGPNDGWIGASLPIDMLAGREVVVRLSVEGEGIGVFGEPRLVVPEAKPMGVVVVLVDTLRADRLGPWTSAPGLSPTLDRLAAEGVVFEHVVAPTSWTKPSVASIFTGVMPTVHHLGLHSRADRVPEGVPLLSEAFTGAGWRTASFSANAYASTGTGFERGFGTVMPPASWLDAHYPDLDQLAAAGLSWLDEAPDQSWFLYLQPIEPHEYPTDWPRLGTMPTYDEQVRAVDARLSALLDGLRARGALDDVLVVVTSDHGESFGDHGVEGHGTSLWDSQVRVPMIVWSPGVVQPRRVAERVSLLDLTPTLTELAGVPGVPNATGTSLVPLLGGADWMPTPAFSVQQDVPMPLDVPPADWLAVVAPDGRKLLRRDDGHEVVVDLVADPCEAHPRGPAPDLSKALDAFVAEQATARTAWVEAYGEGEQVLLNTGDLQRLRALGYVE